MIGGIGFLRGLVFMEIVVKNESCKGLLLCCVGSGLDTSEAGPEKRGDKSMPFFGDASTAGKVCLAEVGTDQVVEFGDVEHGSNEGGRVVKKER